MDVFCQWIYKKFFQYKMIIKLENTFTYPALFHLTLHISKDSLNICFIYIWAKCCILLMNHYSLSIHNSFSLLLRGLGFFFFQFFTYINNVAVHVFLDSFFCMCVPISADFHRIKFPVGNYWVKGVIIFKTPDIY